MRRIDPRTRPWFSMKSSDSMEMTSTRAFPTPTTSRSAVTNRAPYAHPPMHDASQALEESAYRLPRTVLPRRYELTMEPDLDAAAFVGEEAVAVEIVEPVTEIVVNAKELDIDEAWVVAAGERIDCTFTLDAERERMTITPSRSLDPGDANVHVRFHGVLNDKLTGFYRSVYTDAEGTK